MVVKFPTTEARYVVCSKSKLLKYSTIHCVWATSKTRSTHNYLVAHTIIQVVKTPLSSIANPSLWHWHLSLRGQAFRTATNFKNRPTPKLLLDSLPFTIYNHTKFCFSYYKTNKRRKASQITSKSNWSSKVGHIRVFDTNAVRPPIRLTNSVIMQIMVSPNFIAVTKT